MPLYSKQTHTHPSTHYPQHGDPVAEDGPVAEAPVHGDDSAVPDAIDPMVGAVDYTTGRDRLESRVHTLG